MNFSRDRQSIQEREAVREIEENIRRTGMAVRPRQTGMRAAEERMMQNRAENKKTKEIREGRYVPDAAHIDRCLNCTKKNCKGSCREVRAARQEKRR